MNNARYCRKCGCYLPDKKYICLACGLDNYQKPSAQNDQPKYYYSTTWRKLDADLKPKHYSRDCFNCAYSENAQYCHFVDCDNNYYIRYSIFCNKRNVHFLYIDHQVCPHYIADSKKIN